MYVKCQGLTLINDGNWISWAVGAGACLLEESAVLTIDKGAIVSIGIEQRIEWGGTFESSELVGMLGKLIFKGLRLLFGLGLAVALFMIGLEIKDVSGIEVSYDQRSYGSHGFLYALQVVMGGQGWRQSWNNAGWSGQRLQFASLHNQSSWQGLGWHWQCWP